MGHRPQQLTMTYKNGPFERGLIIDPARTDSPARYANGGMLYRIELQPRQSWHACVFWRPGSTRPSRSGRRAAMTSSATPRFADVKRDWVNRSATFTTSAPAVTQTVRQAVDDLAGLRMHRHDAVAGSAMRQTAVSQTTVPTARPTCGCPRPGCRGSLSLFGRDALTVSLQTLALSPRFARRQPERTRRAAGRRYDDARDMQPGKIAHEVRHGDWPR